LIYKESVLHGLKIPVFIEWKEYSRSAIHCQPAHIEKRGGSGMDNLMELQSLSETGGAVGWHQTRSIISGSQS
jgi:hypothetical protein